MGGVRGEALVPRTTHMHDTESLIHMKFNLKEENNSNSLVQAKLLVLDANNKKYSICTHVTYLYRKLLRN